MAVTAGVHHYSQTRAKPARQRKTPEADFQRRLVEALTFALPEQYAFFASMVGTNVGRHKGGDLKALGVRADFPDLNVINLDTGAWRGLECKSLVGSLSAGQRALRDRLGTKWATVKTLDQAQAALLAWHIPLKMPLIYANANDAPIWTLMSGDDRSAAWLGDVSLRRGRYAVAAGGPGR